MMDEREKALEKIRDRAAFPYKNKVDAMAALAVIHLEAHEALNEQPPTPKDNRT